MRGQPRPTNRGGSSDMHLKTCFCSSCAMYRQEAGSLCCLCRCGEHLSLAVAGVDVVAAAAAGCDG
jgi:hypothetical protein